MGLITRVVEVEFKFRHAICYNIRLSQEGMMEFEGKEADLAEEFFSDAKREVPLWLYRVILVVYVLSIVVLVVAGIGMVSIFIDIDLRGAGKLALAGLVVSVMVLIVFSHLKDSCKGVSKTEMAI